jgi:hypothetical protein
MGAPTSSVLSKIYLQYLEHTTIFDAPIQQNITGYYRYVDDILLIYDTRHTGIEKFLDQFNKIYKGVSLHWNKNKITLYTSLTSPSPEQITTSNSRYIGNPQ